MLEALQHFAKLLNIPNEDRGRNDKEREAFES